MKIEKNKIVSVTYELKELHSDNVIEVSDKSNPLIFPYGLNMLLPAFESALYNKETGDVFEIEMDVENAYGKVNDFMIVNIPKNVFMVDGQLDTEMIKVGNRLPMMSQDGNMMNGLVSSIGENEIVMNFNHPLAGKGLHFIGEIIEVRDATEEELAEINGEGCGEGCGDDCGDNCDKNCKH